MGEVQGLLNFAQIFIRNHPDRLALITELENLSQASLAQLEYLPDAAGTADAVIQGHQFVLKALRGAAEAGPEKSQA